MQEVLGFIRVCHTPADGTGLTPNVQPNPLEYGSASRDHEEGETVDGDDPFCLSRPSALHSQTLTFLNMPVLLITVLSPCLNATTKTQRNP